MKTLFALFAASLACFAQAGTLTPTASATSLRPGQSTVITLSFSGTPAPVAIQWTLTVSPLTSTVPVAGNITPKVLSTNPANGRAIVMGTTNAALTPLAPGALATATLTVPVGTLPGTVSIVPTSVVGADISGNTVAVAVGTPLVLTILPPLGDLNGDGKVDATDYLLEMGQALGITACTTGDLNGDGICDVKDLVLIAKQI